MIRGDIELLQQLLANLLENALQHAGQAPNITVSLDSHHRHVGLEVADDGPGIRDQNVNAY